VHCPPRSSRLPETPARLVECIWEGLLQQKRATYSGRIRAANQERENAVFSGMPGIASARNAANIALVFLQVTRLTLLPGSTSHVLPCVIRGAFAA
jgi:hypothetical protein